MKRIISLSLAIIFCLTLIACNGGEQSEDPDTNEDKAPEIVDGVYDLSSDNNSIKTHGRTAVSSSGLICDPSASGIEFNAYIEGDLKVVLNISQSSYVDENGTNEAYFTLYIDGVRSDTRFRAVAGENTLTLASFEQGGIHNIKLIKQTEAHRALCTIKSVSFRGYFEERPADKDLLIEFIGDSITVGFGNLCTISDPNRSQAIMQDATKAYSYLTAEKLDADASLICCSGMGIALGHRPFTAAKFFAADSYYRDVDAKFKPTRVPDVVVINLGTNDQNKGASTKDVVNEVRSLIALVRNTYGKKVPIVWAHGAMGNGLWEPYIEITVEKTLKGEENGIYSIALPQNREGGGGHPGLEAHGNYAELIAKFLKEKNIIEVK